MKNLKFLSLILLVCLGCATLPESLKKPENAKKSILAVSIKHKAPIGIFSEQATTVFFVKVNKPDDMFKSNDIIESNYTKGDYVYLINAEPGKYVAVATMYMTQQQCTVYLNEELIKSTVTTVKPGEIAFMGKYTVKNGATVFSGFKEETQKHYRSLLSQNESSTSNKVSEVKTVANKGVSYSSSVSIGVRLVYDGILEKVEREETIVQEFLQAAKKAFQDTGWIAIIDKKVK